MSIPPHTTTPPHPGSELVPVGYFSKAHGIRGELVMVLQAESPDILQGVIYVRPRHGGAVKNFRVQGLRRHHGNLLVSLQGVSSRNDAEQLRSHTVLVPEEKLPPLEEGEVYQKDLPGLRVFVVERGKEREIGRISAVSAPAGQDLWAIVTEKGREILFPAVEEFVVSIDLEAGRAVIDPPPGLLDLYLDGEG